jgi:GNAT superfamily N-acetyltransferase
MFEIRPYQDGDRDKLRVLMLEVWPDRPVEAFERRWWWHSANPPLTVVEGLENGAIVGLCAHIEFSLYAHGKLQHAAWLVDFFVSDRFQGLGLGKRLTQALMARYPITASLSQTNAAWRAFQKLGWHDRQTAQLYLNVLPLVSAAMPIVRFFLPDAPILEIRETEILSSSSLEAYEDDIDTLWQKLRYRYDILVSRSTRDIIHRYAPRPDRTYRFTCAYRDNELIGYMVTRLCPSNSLKSLKRFPVGLIVDYLLAPEEDLTFGVLLDRAGQSMVALGAKCLLCLSTLPEFHKRLTSRGYLHAKSPFLGRKLSAMNIGFTYFTEVGLERPSDSKWFLTLGDCDMDLLWGETSF